MPDALPDALPVALPDLLSRTARGDAAAYARLYDATVDGAYGVALQVLGDPDRAEEVTRAAYLFVWTHAARHDGRGPSADAWIAAVVHRHAVDRLREAQRWVGREAAEHHRRTARALARGAAARSQKA